MSIKKQGLAEDKGRFYLSGLIVFSTKRKDPKTGEIRESISIEHNIFVDNSARLYRNLMFGESEPVKLNFGDLNFTDTDDWDNPPPAQPTDSTMVNKLGEVPIQDQQKVDVNGNPGIQYTFVMPYDQYNGLNTTDGTTKIVEWGLATDTDDTLYTKKNRRVVYKDQYIEITIVYTISLQRV